MKTLVSSGCSGVISQTFTPEQEFSTEQEWFDLARYDHENERRNDESPLAVEPILGEPRTGVDTLRLLYPLRLTRVPDFHVLTRRDLKKSRFGEHPLWEEEDGRRRWGVMAVRRCGAFRFRIAPVKPGGDAMLRVFFSAPRARFGHNGRALTQCELIEVMQEMQHILATLGVEIDWLTGQVCRLDVCRDVLLPRPFHYYRGVLRLVWPKYNRLCQNYLSGIVRGSASRCVFTQYDKRAERELRGIKEAQGDGLPAPFSAWLRTECRLPTALSVRQKSGIESVADLVARYDELSAWMDERITKDLMPTEPPLHIAFPCEPRETMRPNDELWWQSQLQGESSLLKDRLALMGLRLMVETMEAVYSEPEVWALLKQWCSDDANLSSLRAQMRATALDGYSDELLPQAQLYAELRGALLAPPPGAAVKE